MFGNLRTQANVNICFLRKQETTFIISLVKCPLNFQIKMSGSLVSKFIKFKVEVATNILRYSSAFFLDFKVFQAPFRQFAFQILPFMEKRTYSKFRFLFQLKEVKCRKMWINNDEKPLKKSDFLFLSKWETVEVLFLWDHEVSCTWLSVRGD